MLRQTWGSVVCPGCNNLVGVQDDRCLNCGRWNPGLWGFAPILTRLGRDLGFTPFVIVTCAILYAATLLFNPSGIQMGGLMFLSPNFESLFVFGAGGAVPIFEFHRWWTVLTAGWLHGGLLHIGFNMMSLRNMAPIVAEFYGPSRMAIIYIVSGVSGAATTALVRQYATFIGSVPLIGAYFSGANFSVGASASIAGLIGAIFYYGSRAGSRGASEQAKQWIVGMLLFGLMSPVIDNWGHLGGLGGGYLCAKFLDPLYPERADHLLIAIGLLLATAVAFIASIAYALPLL